MSPATRAPASGWTDHAQLIQAQMHVMSERIAKLEHKLKADQDAIDSFANRVMQENAKLDARIEDLQASTTGHLGTVDATFRRCDQAMEELRKASREATTAVASALAAAPEASSSSTGINLDAVQMEMQLLRQQADAGSVEQLGFSERANGLEERIVAQDLNIQSAVQEITTVYSCR